MSLALLCSSLSLSLSGKSKGFVDLQLTLQSAGFADLASRQEWWEVQENCENHYFDWLPHYKHCRFLTIYTFNDKTFPKGLSFISGGG